MSVSCFVLLAMRRLMMIRHLRQDDNVSIEMQHEHGYDYQSYPRNRRQQT